MANETLGIDLLADEFGDLVVGADGDLAITTDGRTCLLQDAAALLETLPGDLFGHSEYGAGLPNLVGEDDGDEFADDVKRAIEDAFTFEDAVAGRIDPDSVEVDILTTNLGEQAQFNIVFAPSDDPENLMNLVWPNTTPSET